MGLSELKALKERTGASFADCKKALKMAADFEGAVTIATQLAAKRDSLEQRKMQEKNNKELEDLKTTHANDQADQKIKLEKEMQVLQKCMEDMKAVFRLN